MMLRLVRYVAIAAALAVPAVVVAQNLPPSFPTNGFTSGTQIRAAALTAMATEITSLRTRVAALEQRSNAQGIGTIRMEDTFANGTNATRNYSVTGHGLLIAVGRGSSFNLAGVDVTVQGSLAGRSRSGGSLVVPVRAGDSVSLQVSGLPAPGAGQTNNIDVLLFPLSANADLQPQ